MVNPCPADAQSAKGCSSPTSNGAGSMLNSTDAGSLPVATTPLHESCEHCRRLDQSLQALTEAARAMNRLADLLPAWIAVNESMLEMLAEMDDEDDDAPSTYLDGTPIKAHRA